MKFEGEATARSSVLVAVALSGAYISISAVLINFNKYMMHKDRFPHAMMLTTLHMVTSMLCSLVLLALVPSLFTGLHGTAGKRLQVAKYFIPLAGLFAVGVVLSNEAYKYCEVPFLQFMKQGNISIIFIMSCVVGTQTLDRTKVFIVAWIMAGSALAIDGEVHFVLVGFLIQLGSQLGECSKNIMQEWLLGDSGIKLDPFTYNLFMAPACLLVLSVGNIFVWEPAILVGLLKWWPYLLVNAFSAFALNVTVAMLIKHTSVMTFILAGVVKDMVIVTASSHFHGTTLAQQQVVGFSLATCGILMWSLAKLYPNNSAVTVVARVLGSRDDGLCDELLPLTSRESPMWSRFWKRLP